MVVVTYYREAIVNNHPPLVAVEASTGFSMVGVPDPFSSRPNIKEEKVVWLCETIIGAYRRCEAPALLSMSRRLKMVKSFQESNAELKIMK